MIKHIITKGDIVSDLLRVVYFSDQGFDNKDAQIFYNHAKEEFKKLLNTIPASEWETISKQFKKAENTSISLAKRREHILTAAQILQ